MKLHLRQIILTILVLSAGVLPLPAQRLLIQALDQTSGNPIQGVVLSLTGDGRKAVSDATGMLILEGVGAGTYQANFNAESYRSRQVRVEIREGASEYRTEVFLSPLVIDLQAFEVEGRLEDEDRDALVKREAVAPVDQVSGAALQDITDDQVSDTLERVAGVNVDSTDGDVSGINIRGAGARQTRITVDGQGAPGGGGRGTTRGVRAMNRIPREFLDRIQVMKASTPDMDADAIGGTVDLQTSRISRLNQPRSSVSLRNSYQETPNLWGHRLNLTHAQPISFGENKPVLGLLLGINADKASNISDELRVLNQWPMRTDPGTGEPAQALARFRVSSRGVERSGYGMNFNADLRLNKQHLFYFKSFWSEDTQDLTLESLTHDFIRGRVVSIDPVSGEFENMRMERQYLERRNRNKVYSLAIGAEHRFGDWFIDESIGYSKTKVETPDSNTAIFRTSRDLDGGYELDPTWKFPILFLSNAEDDSMEEILSDASQYSFVRYDLIEVENEDAELATRLNVTRNWEGKAAKWTFKGGIKGRFREAEIDEERMPYQSTSGGFPLSSVIRDSMITGYSGRYLIGNAFSPDAMEGLFASNPKAFTFDGIGAELQSARGDFSVTESIYAAYGMIQRETRKWIFIGGVRMERTDFESTGVEVLQSSGDVQINRVTISDTYDMVFPGLHALYRSSERLFFRASLTRALQRPDFRDLSPSTRVNLDTRRIRAGNPELEPFDAKAADLGADWVLNQWSSLSLGVFYKRIDDFIVDVEESTEYEGESGYIISQPVNGSPAKLYGFEMALSSGLPFLPQPMDTMSLNINYTLTDSTAAYPGHPGVIIMLPEQVRQTLNVGLRWKLGDWTMNLRSRYRGLQLRDLTAPGQDQFQRGFWSHSLSVNYKFNDTISLSLGANNLTAPARIQYQGREGRLLSNRESTRAYSLGVNIKFGKGIAALLGNNREQRSEEVED